MAKKPKSRTTKTKRKTPAKSQKTRFKEAARLTGADETGEAFESAMSKLVPPRKPNS